MTAGRWEGVILVEGPSVESCCLLNPTALLRIVDSNGEKCCIRKKTRVATFQELACIEYVHSDSIGFFSLGTLFFI